MEETQTTDKKSIGPIVIGIILLILLGGGSWYMSAHKSSPTFQQNAQTGITPIASATVEKVFTVKGRNFAFSPNQITVKKGDKVKIVFQDDDGFHNLIVDGYNVQTATIGTGNTSQVEFTADKSGTFAFYCSVGNHREKGMQGSLTVE